MAPMAITGPMPDMPRNPDPAGLERWGLAAVAALALATAALAVPRLTAGTLFALAPNVRENPLAARDGDEAATALWLRRSQDWSPWGDAGAAEAKALDKGRLPGRRQALQETLAGSPLRPDLWLALGQDWLADSPERALAAWRMSVFASRVHPPAMAQRLALGLRLQPHMDAADLDRLRDQTRLTFVLMPAQTNLVFNAPENAVHRPLYASVVSGLSSTDIDHMVRIHALH